MRKYLTYLKGDPVIWMISLLMLAFSLVTVYSFVPILVKIEGGTPFHYLFKHFVYVLLGFFSIYFISSELHNNYWGPHCIQPQFSKKK
jgi:cell division protein FtsW